jgi:predicted ATP-binding protein involved in virulence
MIASIYLEKHEYLIKQPQIINLGAKYLYSFMRVDENIIVSRKLNDRYIPNFFDISESACKIKLLSAIVGQNGVGKSTILDCIRSIFVEHTYSMPHNISTVLVEVNGETKVLISDSKVNLVLDHNDDTNSSVKRDFKIESVLKSEKEVISYKELEVVDILEYQSLYYSPHFDLKYNSKFSEVDGYDISLDQFIKLDLLETDKWGTNENGIRFDLHDELLLKNSMRQIEFLNSSIFKNNLVFREVFNLPNYNTGILYIRDVVIPEFNDTPNPLRPIIKVILEKVKNENKNWIIIRDENSHLEDKIQQALINRHFLERFVIKAFISTVIDQMEKRNTWLEEGKIEDPYNIDRFKHSSAKDVLFYFIKESYIESGKKKHPIFNYKEILPFFSTLESLFANETNPNYVTKQYIRLKLEDLKEVLELHKKIVLDLLHYYPAYDGLIDKTDYTNGFIAFRPTDRNMSSGENALLNFFSKLYSFIENNLVEQSKSLPDKRKYILLLDEADLGFHPVWKKRYVDAILKTLPFFFESLKVIPNLQIIITTHDPLTLSDLPINNVTFLQKDNGFCNAISDNGNNKIQKTFGANITDLLAHSFFVDNGLIGDFAKTKIKEVIDWVNESKVLSDKAKSSQEFGNKLDYYKKVVNLIDEKVVKMKLAEMITDLMPDIDYYNQVIDEEINFLINKRK